MTLPRQRHCSFVFRIWWEQADTADSQPIWRGWMQHVPTGETVYVQDVEGLLAFIERWAGRLAPPAKSSTRLK